MTELHRLSGTELAEVAREQAATARENDERLSDHLKVLLATLDEMTRRLDDAS